METNNQITAKLDTIFPHIAGYDEIRKEAYQIIDILQNPDLYKKRGAHCPRGWLLYGKPGTGKSCMVRDMAAYLKIPLIEISSSDAIKRKISVEQDVEDGFSEASRCKKAIVLIDEIEKIAGYRSVRFAVEENLRIQKLLLHALDEIKPKENVIVIATCNDLDLLGSAMTRSGRFDRQIHFSLPTAKDRQAILTHFLKGIALDPSLSMNTMVELTNGLSGADIECVVNEAVILAIGERRGSINSKDISMAIRRIVLRDVPKEVCFSKETHKLIAYHEAGHAYVAFRLAPDTISSASILQQGEGNGSLMAGAGQEDDAIKTKEDMLHSAMIGLAGMLCVKLMSGKEIAGNKKDIEMVKSTIMDMLDEGFYGIENVSGTFSFGYDAYSSEDYLNCRTKKVFEVMESLAKKTEAILLEGKEEIEALSDKLLESGTLTGEEIREELMGHK